MDTSHIKNKNKVPSVIKKNISLYHILSLRLEGKCSLESISTYLKRFKIENSSVGLDI